MISIERYFDNIMEHVCDVCVQPSIVESQEALDKICGKCVAARVVKSELRSAVKAAACTAEREVRRKNA